jgi:osmotically-inducible protein OsmY
VSKWLIGLAVIFLAGCGMSEEEQQRAANDAAAKAQEQAAVVSERLRSTYDDAYAQGRKLAAEIGDKASDEVLRVKLLAAFKLMKPLDSGKLKVRVEKGVIYLDGSVKTEKERMMAEGLAYGVTGDGKRVQSTVTVPKP